ncbi:hypothetical protein K439DRAFT_10370 [Ramaria rubella]|nr:hypothetical protein K439DRAFT_10370 [Ramaria rubella]
MKPTFSGASTGRVELAFDSLHCFVKSPLPLLGSAVIAQRCSPIREHLHLLRFLDSHPLMLASTALDAGIGPPLGKDYLSCLSHDTS